MSPIPLAIEVTIACCLAVYFLHHYGNWKRQHVMVTVATFIAWYFSLMIIFILPMDVSNTCYRQCVKDHSTPFTTLAPYPNVSVAAISYDSSASSVSGSLFESSSLSSDSTQNSVCKEPWSYVSPIVLTTLWHIVYWTSQFLTWLLLPLMQSYANAGDFTIAGKLKSAMIENAIYYGTYLSIFLICLIYVAASPNLHLNGMQLRVLAATASNTWGLFLLVLLLGYGLVEVPRTCWYSSRSSYMLQYMQFKLAKLSVEKSEAEEALEDAMMDVKKAAESTRYNDPLRKCVDTILAKCPETVRTSIRPNREDFQDYVPSDGLSEKGLVKLHKRVIQSTQTSQRTQCQWHMLMEDALDLEDVIANETSGKQSFSRSFGRYEGIFQRCYSPVLEWYWKCRIRGYLMKFLAVLVALVAAMVVWSECLFFITEPVLSLFAIFIRLAKENYSYVAIEMISCATISFLCICTYFTIFRLRILNYYYLASHHQTSENSLIFSGMLLCRLTPPLCLNFLGLIHMDTHVTKKYGYLETAYTQIMGHMDVISFIANGFNIYFPIAIILFCIATYFNIAARFLHCLGFQQFVGDDDITQELVDEGRELLKRERRRRQREEDSQARRRNWQERFEASRSTNAQDSSAEVPSRRRRDIAANAYANAAMVAEGDNGRKSKVSSDKVETVSHSGSKESKTNNYSELKQPKNENNESKANVNSEQKQPKKEHNAGTADPRQLTARSPVENDRAELLKEAEPIDYATSSRYNDPFADESQEGSRYQEGNRYQGGQSRYSRNASATPRGIFDDV